MLDIRRTIHQFFVKEGMMADGLAVAVSGGADSTALLLVLAGFTKNLLVVHVNHHLRGADSDADQAFVEDFARDLGLPVRVEDGSLHPALVRSRGIEAAAREVRYARLSAVRWETGRTFVATAHQKDDQAETVLMRLLTGSGIGGLRGIHPIRADGFIRPMLGVSRSDVEAFLRSEGVRPRHDDSNDDPRFLRNRVRVFLRETGGIDALAAIATQAREQWPVLQHAIDEADRMCVESDDHETRFLRWPDDAWLRGALLQRHIRRLDPHARDFDAQRLARELPQIRRASVTKELELVRRGEVLVLRRPPERIDAFEIDVSEGAPAFIPPLGITIGIEKSTEGTASGRQTIQLPSGADPQFTVRNRRPGDRFQPLGLSAPKKLKDFLIDRKIPAEVRDRLPLLVWNGEIVWVPGVEVSDRFKVTGGEGVRYEVWTDDRDHSGLQR